MPEGMAKTANADLQVTKITKAPEVSELPRTNSAPSWEGVPISVYRYFGVDFGKADKTSIEQLRDIYSYSSETSKDKSIVGIINTIKRLEHRLGAPRANETAYSKMWNYVQLSMHMNSIKKERKVITGR